MYKCLNSKCGQFVELDEDGFGVRCPFCGGRIFRKVDPREVARLRDDDSEDGEEATRASLAREVDVN